MSMNWTKFATIVAITALLIGGAVMAVAQTTQCVEVPDQHKIVFIPWVIPVDELTWKWQRAKVPATPDGTDGTDGVCERKTVISPALPDPDCEPVYCDETDLVVSPSVCIER